jgi:peptide/nickel transport system ATP-binding protein
MEPLLRVCDLTVRPAGERPIVDGISFDLIAGEVLGLVGESGSGKTTVALSLLGDRPRGTRTTGQVVLDGQDVLTLPQPALRALRGRRIAYVPQNPTTALNPARRIGDLLVEQVMAHGAAADRSAAWALALRTLGDLGLSDPAVVLRRYPHQLSGGQQQRVVLALATICSPDVLVLDEPTTGLDVTTQALVIAELRRLQDEQRMAMLYVTHDLGLLAEIATSLAVLYAGRLVELGPAGEVFAQPRHPYTKALLEARPRIAGGGVRPLRGILRRSELPPGCAFAPRCDRAGPDCAQTPQPLRETGPSRLAACQYWQRSSPLVAVSVAAREAPAGTRAADTTLAVRDLSVRYPRGVLGFGRRGPPALSPLSFDLRAGEILAVVGESGSGKSTLAKALAGLLPFTGEARFDGEPLPVGLSHRPVPLLRRVQIVFQNPDAALNPRRRVRSILADALRAFESLPPDVTASRLRQVMEDVRLPPSHLERYPDELSGGERQRVAIARALLVGPELLICDEVLSALDVSVQAGVLDLLQSLRDRMGLAILFISHDLAVVHAIADHILVLYRGTLLARMPKAAMLSEPRHPYVHDLLAAIPGERLVEPRRPPSGRTVGGEGCPYAPRCPVYLGATCEQEMPAWAGAPLGLRCHRHPPVEPVLDRTPTGLCRRQAAP